jgi:DNA-directed RNA polymerase subunit M/transcription elongation factor TFIIS
MYYVELGDHNTLTHYCRKCGNNVNYDNHDKIICVINSDINTVNKDNLFINKYTKHDPTLPRVDNIPCPNDNCDTNTKNDVSNEVIYIRTDDINMKYTYICSICDTTWNT